MSEQNQHFFQLHAVGSPSVKKLSVFGTALSLAILSIQPSLAKSAPNTVLDAATPSNQIHTIEEPTERVIKKINDNTSQSIIEKQPTSDKIDQILTHTTSIFVAPDHILRPANLATESNDHKNIVKKYQTNRIVQNGSNANTISLYNNSNNYSGNIKTTHEQPNSEKYSDRSSGIIASDTNMPNAYKPGNPTRPNPHSYTPDSPDTTDLVISSTLLGLLAASFSIAGAQALRESRQNKVLMIHAANLAQIFNKDGTPIKNQDSRAIAQI